MCKLSLFPHIIEHAPSPKVICKQLQIHFVKALDKNSLRTERINKASANLKTGRFDEKRFRCHSNVSRAVQN